MSLRRALYRDLVACARRLDAHASRRALLCLDLQRNEVVPGSRERLLDVERFNETLQRYLLGRHFYLPDRRPSVLQLVREEFRKPLSADKDGDGLDMAFLALRALNDTLAMAKELELPNEESVLLDGVQLAEKVTTGVFLLAHPLLEGIFGRSVVVLTEYSDRTTKGFIVNKLSKKTLLETFSVPSRITRAFGTCDVRLGGPVFSKSAAVLHGKAEFGGQRVVATNFPTAKDPSLFVGVDLETAARAIYDESAKQTDLVFMNGESGWSPGQLDRELEQGSWIAVTAPLSLALNAPKELWEDMMQSLGGEYAEMSRLAPMDDE